jgi:hypothetical protein
MLMGRDEDRRVLVAWIADKRIHRAIVKTSTFAIDSTVANKGAFFPDLANAFTNADLSLVTDMSQSGRVAVLAADGAFAEIRPGATTGPALPSDGRWWWSIGTCSTTSEVNTSTMKLDGRPYAELLMVPGIGSNLAAGTDAAGNLYIGAPGRATPLATRRGVFTPAAETRAFGDRFYSRDLARWIVFAPHRGFVAWMNPITRDIEQVSIDLAGVLLEPKVPQLIITSAAPMIELGESWNYAITTLTNGGELKYELIDPPRGAKVSPNGNVSWRVPRKLAGDTVRIALMVTAKDGQVASETLEFRVVGAK